MVIKNGFVLDGCFKFLKTDISFEREIQAIGENLTGEVFDATGCYVIPGLVDTHFHAAMGETFIDFNEETAKYDAKGNLTVIYLKGEVCGFAIHLVKKK